MSAEQNESVQRPSVSPCRMLQTDPSLRQPGKAGACELTEREIAWVSGGISINFQKIVY